VRKEYLLAVIQLYWKEANKMEIRRRKEGQEEGGGEFYYIPINSRAIHIVIW
jgi:hypothetical protein